MQSVGSTQEVYRKYTRGAQEAHKRSTGSHGRSTSCTLQDHRKYTCSLNEAPSSSQEIYRKYTEEPQEVFRRFIGSTQEGENLHFLFSLVSFLAHLRPTITRSEVKYGLHRPCSGTTKHLTRFSDMQSQYPRGKGSS